MEELELKNSEYDSWNEKKKILEARKVSDSFYFSDGDIWWCSLGRNIGTESYGKGEGFRRPVLVIKKLSHSSCIVLPLSTQEKKGTWFVEVPFGNEKRYVLLYQIKMVHVRRFQRNIGLLDREILNHVKEKLADLLELSSNHHPAEAGIEGDTLKTDIVYLEPSTNARVENLEKQ